MMVRPVIALMLMAAIAESPPMPVIQNPDDIVRLRAELVELEVLVVDRKGNPVLDLTKEMFNVLENRRRQTISFFSLQGRGSEEIVNTPRRATVMLVDTLHLSLSSVALVKKGLRDFIDSRPLDDEIVAIATPTGQLGVFEQFSSDRQFLRRAVERLRPESLRRETLFSTHLAAMIARGDPRALALAVQILRAEGEFADPEYATLRAGEILIDSTNRRRRSLHAISGVIQNLSELNGERVLMLLSDGFSLVDHKLGYDTEILSATAAAARNARVAINAIDARGLQTSILHDASIRISTADGSILQRVASESRSEAREGLSSLATETGGQLFLNTNDFLPALEKVAARELGYYRIGYYPSHPSRSRATSPVVRLNGLKGYRVLTSNVTTPPRAEAPTPGEVDLDRVFRLMASPIRIRDLDISAEALHYETPEDESQISISLNIASDGLDWDADDREPGNFGLKLDVITMMFDDIGRLLETRREHLSGKLNDDELRLARRKGLQYGRRVAVKPGTYQFRFAVVQPSTAKVATANAWVEVPDPRRNHIVVSSIRVSDGSSQELRRELKTDAGRPLERESWHSGGARIYRPGASLVYFIRIGVGSKRQDLTAARYIAEIYRGQESIYSTGWNPVDSFAVREDSLGVEVGGKFGLDLPPGVYDLRITVKSSSGKTFERQVMFTVQ